MAVYTHISEAELIALLSRYDLGTLVRFEGIAQGVSNTNYHVFTDRGRYILTIFEEHRTRGADLPFFFTYAEHLAGRGIVCPQAIADMKGQVVQGVQGKPAALISFVAGLDIARGQTNANHAHAMGAFTARMHVAAQDFADSRDNDWAIPTWRMRFDAMAGQIEGYQTGMCDVIKAELSYLEALSLSDLPSGVVHVDLFPDNIFFVGDEISAMIDMYFACHEAFIYDFAIVVNAWCFLDDVFYPTHFKSLFQGYDSVRKFERAELGVFQDMLRAASMRFLISRLEEWFAHDPKAVEMDPHDPQAYLKRLQFHQSNNIVEHIIEA